MISLKRVEDLSFFLKINLTSVYLFIFLHDVDFIGNSISLQVEVVKQTANPPTYYKGLNSWFLVEEYTFGGRNLSLLLLLGFHKVK